MQPCVCTRKSISWDGGPQEDKEIAIALACPSDHFVDVRYIEEEQNGVVVPKVTWAAAGSSLFFDFKDGKGKVQWIYKIDALKDQPTTDDGEITQTEVDGVKVDNISGYMYNFLKQHTLPYQEQWYEPSWPGPQPEGVNHNTVRYEAHDGESKLLGRIVRIGGHAQGIYKNEEGKASIGKAVWEGGQWKKTIETRIDGGQSELPWALLCGEDRDEVEHAGVVWKLVEKWDKEAV